MGWYDVHTERRFLGCWLEDSARWSCEKGRGNFMRDFSLDEFYNVLKCDLSMVGAYPPTADEWAKFHYHYCARLSIKPDIIGL